MALLMKIVLLLKVCLQRSVSSSVLNMPTFLPLSSPIDIDVLFRAFDNLSDKYGIKEII